jgi:hypothetical protein
MYDSRKLIGRAGNCVSISGGRETTTRLVPSERGEADMPRGKPNEDQGADPRSNKMEAVRQAMQSLGNDAAPLEIQKFIKEKFNQDMDPNMISTYKSSVRKKAGLRGRRRRRGRPKKGEAVAASATTLSFHEAVPWKDLRTIKDIAGRIGKKGLRELVDWLD